MYKLTINGELHSFERKTSILKALNSVGIEVPTLCHDARLLDVGACRLCVVKIAGSDRPIVSCETDIVDGLEIETHTPEIEESRVMNLKMLARRYPRSAFRDYPDKPFHQLARKYGLTDLAKGDVMFAATGVTDGAMLKGVRRSTKSAITHSMVMRSKTGTVRIIEAHHNWSIKRPKDA